MSARLTWIALPALLVVPLTGCLFDGSHGAGLCATATSMVVDTGASIDHAAGIDAGYYVTYTAGGHWHLEWTCDTKLSAAGCDFAGTLFVDTPSSGAAVTCFQCEGQDFLDVASSGDQTRIDFDTITSTGIDGIDFEGMPGHDVRLDLQIDGLYQNDLVYVPSRGRTAVPACMPLDLAPSAR
ncbi:MAG TPA: hypothetical protein VFT22_32795 [Kofleriaceae bacterium]|nr:hypothetical protein [Kofleriaceae bacterium]